ncbi:MAG: hypothetical protein OHK0021_09800 [Bryobacter sp.]
MIVEPIETLAARDWLAFAEIAAPSVSLIAREQQFAEKIHAYSLPRTNPNSRVRDLVDLYLLTASGTLDRARCADALRRTFERRATHEVPAELTPPPPEWARPFRAMAEDCELAMECREAFEVVQRFWMNQMQRVQF